MTFSCSEGIRTRPRRGRPATPPGSRGKTAEILKSIFNSYGHMTGLSMGEIALTEAPWISAMARKTEENPRTAYANRSMARYAYG